MHLNMIWHLSEIVSHIIAQSPRDSLSLLWTLEDINCVQSCTDIELLVRIGSLLLSLNLLQTGNTYRVEEYNAHIRNLLMTIVNLLSDGYQQHLRADINHLVPIESYVGHTTAKLDGVGESDAI